MAEMTPRTINFSTHMLQTTTACKETTHWFFFIPKLSMDCVKHNCALHSVCNVHMRHASSWNSPPFVIRAWKTPLFPFLRLVCVCIPQKHLTSYLLCLNKKHVFGLVRCWLVSITSKELSWCGFHIEKCCSSNFFKTYFLPHFNIHEFFPQQVGCGLKWF